MKKTAFCSIALLLLLGIAGCSGKEKSIDIDDVEANTLLARTNGEIQVASVEDFEKDYYKLSELQDFVNKEITTYNNEAGADKITVDKVEVKNQKAYLLLTYSGMDSYCAFNQVSAAYFNGGVKDIKLKLPTTLVTAKDESLASTQDIIQDSSYKILVLYEPYQIMVDGKVQYYSENAALIDKNEVEGAAEGMTIVVYKP